MTSFRRRLPSLHAMLTFEPAARLRNFSLAARELNVSQAAVSRQIKLLEEDLGVKLFVRGNRSIDLTPEAIPLSQSLKEALENVSTTIDGIRETTRAKIIRVGATVAFTHLRLLPRLKDLRDANPNLTIRVISRDEPFDLRRDEIDILMRFGAPPFEDGDVIASIEDKVFPVCSPTFRATAKGVGELEALCDMQLIGTDSQDHAWINWPAWFVQAGLRDRPPVISLHFNHYPDGIAAALAGQGVASGWNFVIHDLLLSGQLVRLTQKSIPSTAAYNVVVSKSRQKNPFIRDAANWFSRMFDEYRHNDR